MNKQSVFFNHAIKQELRRNRAAAAESVKAADYWMGLSDEELAKLMFGPTIKRSWMVLSYGSCPDCGRQVPMYNWKIDARLAPWKLQCPHCKTMFPKNDFQAFYTSGLDDEGYFRRHLADESLLVNEDGTSYGVDDGNGYVCEKDPHRFIGAYLIYGQWMQLVMGGVRELSYAYLLTGNEEYARRTAILLDRIARFFPEFDYYSQGVMYEEEFTSRGYVTYWANTTHDLFDLAMAYDMIVDPLGDAVIGPDGRTGTEIRHAVEKRIFREALANRPRYESNPPHTDLTILILKSVINELGSIEQMLAGVEAIISDSTAIDGLSGEKGLSGYASIAPSTLADIMLLYTNVYPDTIPEMFRRVPRLRKTYRFHIDTWYMERYYPGVGDAGYFDSRAETYVATLRPNADSHRFTRSHDWFTMRLSEILDDPAYIQALVLSRGSEDRCFEDDIFLPDGPERDELRTKLTRIIETHGRSPIQKSVLYDQWRIAILHAGEDEDRRMLSINYDSGANHCHEDALNLGLFFGGANILPDLGYPPVHRGGWHTEGFSWYHLPVSHNTVVIDGKGHENLPEGTFIRRPQYGSAIMHGAGCWFQAIEADAHEYAGVERYERRVALVDIDQNRAYCLDVFDVRGGSDHALFYRTPLATVTTEGLTADGSVPYEHTRFMRNYRTDGQPEPGWRVSADFTDHHEPGVGVRFHGFTKDASVTLCESWVDVTLGIGCTDTGEMNEMWVPTLMVRRQGPESTFINIIEPYRDTPSILGVERSQTQDGVTVLRIDLPGELTDLIVIRTPESSNTVALGDRKITTDATLAAIRFRRSEIVDSFHTLGSHLDIG